MVKSEAGFSLLEAMIALTIGSLIVVLVSQVFLIQNDFYTRTLGRSQADEVVRVTSDLLLNELRTAPVGGVVVATPRRMVVRSPLGVGGVCDVSGSSPRLYMPGVSSLDSAEVSGYAVRDSLGAWVYSSATWSGLLTSIGTGPAGQCAFEGVDTTLITRDFVEFDLAGTTAGDQVMVYREIEYEFTTSVLDPNTLALYRGRNGGTLVELTAGITTGSGFEYRVGSTWTTTVVGSNLDGIDALRVSVRASSANDTITTDEYIVEMSVPVPLLGGGS